MRQVLEEIHVMPLNRFVLLGLTLLGAYYLFYYDDGASIDAQIAVERSQLEEERKALEETMAIIEDGKRFEQEVNAMAKQFEEALEYLPNDLSITDLVRKISAEAQLAGIDIVRITPNTGRRREKFYEEIIIEIELRGEFAAIAMFLSYISKIPRIINIKRIQMETRGMVDSRPEMDEMGRVRSRNAIVSFKGELAGYRYVAGDVVSE